MLYHSLCIFKTSSKLSDTDFLQWKYPVRADPGICRLERRRIKQDLLQLAKCLFGKLARPVLAHPKCK
eukprot:scaffold105404_cov69-Phaeocystis_antarctica.AAC.2